MFVRFSPSLACVCSDSCKKKRSSDSTRERRREIDVPDIKRAIFDSTLERVVFEEDFDERKAAKGVERRQHENLQRKLIIFGETNKNRRQLTLLCPR